MATMNVLDSAGSTVAVEKPLAPGSAADAASRPVAWSTEGKAQIGAVTETAPASDTASSGLNGRLQRVAQRLTSMIALLPTALGAGGGLKVDGSGTALPVSQSGSWALSAGAAIIGAVTQSGSWVLSAGAAIIGKVGIDQTTDGTTNLVRIGAETTKVIGVVRAADGSGNLLTSTANAMDVNIKSGVNANINAVTGVSATAGAPTVNLDPYSNYEMVAASASAQIMGATGAQYDYLAGVLIVPGTAAAGAVSITDGNGSAIQIFAGGGTTALADLKPFMVPLGLYALASTTAGWKITTGANVTAIGIGKFT